MTRDQVIIRELRQVSNFQAEVIRKYAGFMRWMDKEIADYEDRAKANGYEKAKMVEKIEIESWRVRLQITQLIKNQETDPRQRLCL